MIREDKANVTAAEAAQLTGKTRNTVIKLCRKLKGNGAFKDATGRWLISKEALFQKYPPLQKDTDDTQKDKADDTQKDTGDTVNDTLKTVIAENQNTIRELLERNKELTYQNQFLLNDNKALSGQIKALSAPKDERGGEPIAQGKEATTDRAERVEMAAIVLISMVIIISLMLLFIYW